MKRLIFLLALAACNESPTGPPVGYTCVKIGYAEVNGYTATAWTSPVVGMPCTIPKGG